MRITKPKTVKRKVIVAATTGLLAIAGASPALAVSAGGGAWEYGVSAYTNYSNYYHSGTSHGSSVSNNFGTVRSPCTPAGYWAYASQARYPWGNQAFWRHC